MIRLIANQHRLRLPQNIQNAGSNAHGDLAVQFVGEEMEVVLYARLPGKYSESFTCSNADGELRKFHVKANVMPANLGTPALKENVVCISKSNCESDASDWKGF